jgi:small subunit ribosomal protein S1
MTLAETTVDQQPLVEDFAAMLEESFQQKDKIEGTVVTGTVIAIDNDEAVVDVGLKAEGRVPIKEFSTQGNPVEVKVGDSFEIYVERFENRNGEAILSRDKARRPLGCGWAKPEIQGKPVDPGRRGQRNPHR